MNRCFDICKCAGHIRTVFFGEWIGDDTGDAVLREVADDRRGILQIDRNRLIDRHPWDHIAQGVDLHNRRIWDLFGEQFRHGALAGIDGAIEEDNHKLFDDSFSSSDNLQGLRIGERHDGKF